jgi:hypothetical protein
VSRAKRTINKRINELFLGFLEQRKEINTKIVKNIAFDLPLKKYKTTWIELVNVV